MAIAKTHEELMTWQLATELRDRVFAILERENVKKDRNFCEQVRRSCRSAPANFAEGFARYRPREHANFVRIGIGSLGETQNYLREAQQNNYVTKEEFEELWRLSRRAIGAAVKLHKYLKSCAPDHDGTKNRQQKP